jgi:hypothetical protein
MSGAIPPLPNMPSWRGAKLKNRDSFNCRCSIVPNEMMRSKVLLQAFMQATK